MDKPHSTCRGRARLIGGALVAASFVSAPVAVQAAPKAAVAVAPSDPIRAAVQIRGTVTDKLGDPLVGATVVDKKTGNATVTDADGKFLLSGAPDSEISVSYIGYRSRNVKVNPEEAVTVVMEEDNVMLGEVVAVGYGTQRKANLSGAVDQVSSKELKQRPISDIGKGLQGMIPNLNIDFTSGEPGQNARINVRGEGSINGGSPLILIDGVASDVAELGRILPEDIESVSVLKDAASAAIYGARAAFGVIMITTKKGAADKVQVSYAGNFGLRRPSILPSKTSDPYIYLKLKNIAVLNTPWSSGHVAGDERMEWARQRSDNPDGTEPVRLNPLDPTQWEYMGNRDWTKHFLDKNTFSTSHQVVVSGGSTKASYYLSGGIDMQDGVMAGVAKRDDYTRYSLRSKIDLQLAPWLTVGNNTSFVSTVRNKPSYLSSRGEPSLSVDGFRYKGSGDTRMGIFYDLAPTDWDRNPDGTWANNAAGIAMAQIMDGGEEKVTYDRVQSTLSAIGSFFDKSLTINGTFTFAKGQEDYSWFKNKYSIGYGPNDVRQEGTSRAYRAATTDLYTVAELFASYNKTFGLHNVSAVAGFNQEYSRWNWFKAERQDIISTSLPTIGLATGDQFVSEQIADWAIRGLFFRGGYIFKNRYIAEINGRYDGSSRFAKGSRFGFFPSASAAWRVEEEAFFQPIRDLGVNQFKLRGSYGMLGNQLVGEYGYVPSMSSVKGSYLINGSLHQVVTPPGLVSDNYTWERVSTLNGGFDLGMFNNRLTLTADLFRRDSKDMLTLGRQLPGVLGASEPRENAADMRTNGWEISLGYQNSNFVAGHPLNWSVKASLSDSRSTITRFENPSRSLTQYYEGMQVGEIWGLESDGFFQTAEEIAALDQTDIIPWGALDIVPGWPKYIDQDGDGRITKGNVTVDNPGDLKVIGNSSPRLRYGLNLTANWNGFDLSAFIQGVGKRDYYPLSYLYWGFYQQPYAGGANHIMDFYRPEADSDAERAKHSQAYLDAGLADANLNAAYPVFQCWLADKNLGTRIDQSMGMAIPQTKYLLNGAYMRMKNLTLGYTLPQALTRKLRLGSLRFYASADNLFEISQLKKYFDPEAVTEGSGYGYVYPFNRQYTFGINVNF